MNAIIDKLTKTWNELTTTGKLVVVGLGGAAVVAVIWIF